MSKRIGPKMRLVIRLASRPGGVFRIDAARDVGPHGSLCYGYQTVKRCIAQALVHTGYVEGRRGLCLTTTTVEPERKVQ
jgi:hypothetical protein